MKTLKKKTKSIPRTMAVRSPNPDTSDEEEPIAKNVKEVQDVEGTVKTLLFTLTWLEKLHPQSKAEYTEELIANLMDIIDNTESRTQLALFVKGLDDVLNGKNLVFKQ